MWFCIAKPTNSDVRLPIHPSIHPSLAIAQASSGLVSFIMVDDPAVVSDGGVNGGDVGGKGKSTGVVNKGTGKGNEGKVVEKSGDGGSSKKGDVVSGNGSSGSGGSGDVKVGGKVVDDAGGNAKKVKKEFVIPDEPVKRYAEPSRDELRQKIDEQDAIIKAAIAKLDSTRGFYDERGKIREAGREEFQKARKLQTSMNDELRAKFERRKSLSAQISELRDNAGGSGGRSGGSGGGGRDNRDDLPPALRGCKNPEDVDAKIRDLEYQQATASLPIAEEKKLIADIAYLKHKGRAFIVDREKSFSAEKLARTRRITRRKELEEIRRAEDKQIDELKARFEKQRGVVDAIRQKQDKEIEALAAKFSDVDREAERKKIGEARKEIKNIRDAYSAELDKWHMNERIYREQQRIAKRKKWEAAQAEREARRLAYEAEMAQYPKPHPYQSEKDMCTNLITYLNGLIGIEQEKQTKILAPEKSKVPSLGKKALPAREIAPTNAMGKKIGKGGAGADGDLGQTFGSFVKKGKKGKKRGRRSEDAEKSTLAPAKTGTTADKSGSQVLPSHSMERFSAFTQLNIKPPLKRGEVSDAIEALKSKLAYFDSAPPPEEVEKNKMENKPKAAPKEEKKKIVQNAGNLTGSEYPLMNGGSTKTVDGTANGTQKETVGNEGAGGENAAPNTAAKRPSFADIMAGKAKAPAPAPVSTPEASGTGGEAPKSEAAPSAGASTAPASTAAEPEAEEVSAESKSSSTPTSAPTAASVMQSETTPVAAVAQK